MVKLFLTRAGLIQERLWPRLWPALIIVLLFCAAALFSVWELVPAWLHLVGLAGFASALITALHFAVTGWHLPTRTETLARLEDQSDLHHRPLQGLEDTIALGKGSQQSEALWAKHLARQAEMLSNIRLGAPRADVPSIDPLALRVPAVVLALIGFLYAGADWRARLVESVSPNFENRLAGQLVLDAWITPPDYISSAPIYLTRSSMSEHGDDADPLTVPEGSTLTVRLSGTDQQPILRRSLLDKKNSADWRVSLPFDSESTSAFKIDTPILASATLEVFVGRTKQVKWSLNAVPDNAPTIVFTAPPEATRRGHTKLEIEANDDYGLVGVEAIIRLAETEEPLAGQSIIDPTKPLIEEISLPNALPKEVLETVSLDLSDHPWAGELVQITLTARDEIGQTAASETKTIRLPKREFRDPLAQAIIEQRSALTTEAYAEIDRVITALDALTLAPERFMPDTTVFLGLKVAYYRLSSPYMNRTDLRSVYDLFWDLALRIEDGDLSRAEEAVRNAQQALADALARDASHDEIAALLNEQRQAMAALMEALNDAMQRAFERGDYVALPQGAQSLSSQDFDDMMNALEQMALSGARDKAADLLAQMQTLMEQMQLGAGPQPLSEEQAAMSDALNGLGSIVEEQRALMDETFRQSGQAAEPNETDRPANELTRDQAELRERLEQMLAAMTDAGLLPSPDLETAADAMGRAQDDLAAENPAGAVPDQNEALAKLQQGMEQTSQQLAQSLGGNLAMGSGGRSGRDPLGRQNDGTGRSTGTVEVPDESVLRRARQILEEVKRRASDPTRGQDELDYLDRLVPKF